MPYIVKPTILSAGVEDAYSDKYTDEQYESLLAQKNKLDGEVKTLTEEKKQLKEHLDTVLGVKVVIPKGTTTMYGKTVNDLSTDLKVSDVGKVTGKLNHVTGYEGFSKGAEGNFFPFRLDGSGTNMTFKKNGTLGRINKHNFEQDNVLKISNKSDKWEILVDDVSVITLDFTGVELATK